jgi:hypothetical protein
MTAMRDRQRLSGQEIAELASGLRALDWPADPADIDRIAAAFGWRIESRRERGARLGSRFGRAGGRFDFEDGLAVEVSANLCSFADEDSGEDRAWLQDVFADATAAVSGVLGEPTKRIPGDTPELRWRGGKATIMLHRYSVVVDIALATNERVDEHDWAVERGL